MTASPQRRRRYVVTFFKTVTDDYGRDREICQRVIEVAAVNKQQAFSEGATELCRVEGLSDWSHHADRCEVCQAKSGR